MKDYMTIREIANLWGISPRRVQILCNEGRIEGAVKFGRDWAIPMGSEKPRDMRLTTGAYVNWRKDKIKKDLTDISVAQD